MQIILAMLHVAIDVLDRHGRIVDQDADRKSKATERHDIDGLAKHGKCGQRTQNRKRYRNGDDDGRSPAAEKDQNHKPGERGRDHALAHDGADGRFDEVGLVPDELDGDARRKRGLDCRKARLDACNDVERGRRADLENGHQNALAPVELDDIGLRRRTVVDVGDVAHEHDRAVDHLDRKIVEVRDRFG
jgi:hypothetical protein